MADVDEAPFSLMSLEDELTCSICLSTFDCPVTIPCGHNFCQDCLLATWKETYSCPQCRTHFACKPELRKNTVLSTVVETFNLRSSRSEVSLFSEEEKAKGKDVLRCDTCMEAEATQTCLTCMASFCEEHLRPHRDNPIFRLHQLSEPVSDLSERICPDHHKLMELFCSQHGRPICSLCLQHVHKGCSFTSPEEQRNLKESELRDKLGLLDKKIEMTKTVSLQINDLQSQLKDGAAKRKSTLAAVYQQMQFLLAQEERQAQKEVDCELEVGQKKLQDLMKKLSDNDVKMRKARDDINSLLSQSQTTDFLRASFDLPKVVKFKPNVPRINLDSKKVTATQAFAVALKELLTETLKQPVETRLPIIKPVQSAVLPEPPEQRRPPRSHSPHRPPILPYFQPVPLTRFPVMDSTTGWSLTPRTPGMSPGFNRPPPFMARQKTKHGQNGASGGTGEDKPKRHPTSTNQQPKPRKNN